MASETVDLVQFTGAGRRGPVGLEGSPLSFFPFFSFFSLGTLMAAFFTIAESLKKLGKSRSRFKKSTVLIWFSILSWMDLDAEYEAMEESSEEKRIYLGDWRSREVFLRGHLGFLVWFFESSLLEVEDELERLGENGEI